MSTSPRGISLLIWIIVFTVVCSIVLLLRLWAAKLTRRSFFADDGFVLFAYVNTLALEGVCIWAIYNGMGKHTSEATAYEFGVQFKLVVASGVTWLLGTVFVKLAVLWLYTRIFVTPAFKKWSRALMGLVGCYGVAFFVVFMTKCHPITQMWDPVPDGWCRDLSHEEFASVSLNIVLDVMIFILPMPPLWGLQMALRNKIFITIMFSIGLLTIAIMCWRLQATIVSTTNPDFVYTLTDIGLLSLLELWLGIIVACMPTLAPLIMTYVKPALSKITGARSAGSKGVRNNTNTIGGGSRPAQGSRNQKKMYSDVEAGVTTTECVYAPEKETWESPDGIHVRQDVETQDSWRRQGPWAATRSPEPPSPTRHLPRPIGGGRQW